MTEEKSPTQNQGPKFRRWMVVVWALVFFVLIDIGVRIYFSQADLVVRNIDRGIGSLPYLFNQMDKHRGTKVAWVGASVLQGYQNVAPDRTFPALVEHVLGKTKQYGNIRSYNLGAAGHNFGDHYCITAEALRHKPDLVVVAIHFKSFSQHISTSVPIQHKNLTAYLPRGAKRDELLNRFRVTPVQFAKYRIDAITQKIWGFYRYHDLINQMASESADSPAYVILDRYRAAFGMYSEQIQSARTSGFEDRSVDYLWKLLPDTLVMRNHEICSNLDFSDSNINWRTFKDLCELGRKKKANMIFYLTPINRALVAEKNFFDWNMLRGFKQVVAQQVRGNGHLLVDATNVVDYAFFSDTDHINMNGHAQMGIRMTKEVKKALDRGGWKPSRKKRKRK